MTPPPTKSLIRSLALADVVTLCNAAAGTGAIFFCLNHVEDPAAGYVFGAFVLLPLALAADVLDGMVARWRHRKSPYGADLDSLADTVSFGVAPAVLGYALGMDGLWDAVVLVFFVACGIGRLARFNVTAATLEDAATGKVRYFEGTPIPTSMAIVALLAAAWWLGATRESLWGGALPIGPFNLHPLVLVYALSGSLMISRIRIPKP